MLNINYKVIGSVRFYDRKEIKDIISYLQFLVNDSDTVAFERIVNVPRRGIGESTVKKIRVYLNETGKSIFDALESIDEIKNIF